MPSRRIFPPEPAVTGETRRQRWRRKRRTYVLRWFDRARSRTGGGVGS